MTEVEKTYVAGINNEKHPECYSYITRRDAAINFLYDISSYLIIESKKIRVKLILSKYKLLTP